MPKLREIINHVYPKATSTEMRSLTSNINRYIDKEKIPFVKKGNTRYFDLEAVSKIQDKLITISIGQKESNNASLEGKKITLSGLIDKNFPVETQKQKNSSRSIANSYIYDNEIQYSLAGRNTVIRIKDAVKVEKWLKQLQQQPAASSNKALNSKHKASKIPTYDQLLEIIAKKDNPIYNLIDRQEELISKLESIK